MIKKEEKTKVGRPKLADNNLKKKSLIISGICLTFVLALILVGIKILNIKPNKLKGETTEYKIYEVGEEFCLDTECFYVIEDNGDSVTALAKYNLLVGYMFNAETEEQTEIPETTEGYGRQNDSAMGFNMTTNIYTGGLIFSSEEYWDNSGLENERDTKYVFDENSNLWIPLQNYKTYLKSLGYDGIMVTLLSTPDLKKLGCDRKMANCDNAEQWVYQTTYWTGTAYHGGDGVVGIDMVTTSGGLVYANCDFNYFIGLRPVITISKEDLIEKDETITSEEVITTEGTTKKVETSVKATTTSNITKKIVRKNTTTTNESTTTTTEETSKVKIAKIESTNKIKEVSKNKNYIQYVFGGIGIILITGILLVIKGKRK